MQQARVQGVVVLEATIAPSGCVTDIRVRRSVQPPLDYAGIRAVAGWQFRLGQIDNRDVALTMTLTVNFSLR